MRLLITICVSFIFALGLIMVFNTSSAEILDRSLDRNIHQAFMRQIIYAAIGILVSACIWRIGYIHLLRFAPLLLACATLSLILVFVPGIGKMRNGACRWIGIGGFTFQPSEFVKYLLPMCYIDWILLRTDKMINFSSFCKAMVILSIPMVLILIEPDNGTTAVIGATLVPLFFLSKISYKYWALPMLLLSVVGGFAAYQLPYVRGRIQVYLHPESDLKGKGHQPYQAKIAAGSGGLTGKGPGASLQKLTYLPEAQNDYIAAIYGEEFGFIGILALILLYMLFMFGGFTLAMRCQNPGGSYLAATITILIALQAFLNLGVVSGLLPSKGVNLPFFSQGGTSLIANIIGLAVLLNIGKNEKESHRKCRRDRGASFSRSKPC
jgi:cell division protein FtsW